MASVVQRLADKNMLNSPPKQITVYFERKETDLEQAYANSPLPWKADEEAIRLLLLKCLEHHYGSISLVHHCFL